MTSSRAPRRRHDAVVAAAIAALVVVGATSTGLTQVRMATSPVPVVVLPRDAHPDLSSGSLRAVQTSEFELDARRVAYLRPARFSVVRVVSPRVAQLRAFRLVRSGADGDAARAMAWIEVPPIHVEPGEVHYLSEELAVWRLESGVQARARIVTLEEDLPRRAHQDALERVLAWVDANDGAMPALPRGSSALADALRFDEAICRGSEHEVSAEGCRAFRRASAILEFLRHRPMDPRFVEVESPDGPWTELPPWDAAPARGLRRLASGHTAELHVTGPVVLDLQIRAVGPGESALRTLRVGLDDIDVARFRIRAAAALAPPDALSVGGPRLDADAGLDAVGIRHVRRLVVPQGAHVVRVGAEGGALLLDARTLAHRTRFWHWATGDEVPARLLATAASALRAADPSSEAVQRFSLALGRLVGTPSPSQAESMDRLGAWWARTDGVDLGARRHVARDRCRRTALASAPVEVAPAPTSGDLDPEVALDCALETPASLSPDAHAALLRTWRRDPLDRTLGRALAELPLPPTRWVRASASGAPTLRLVVPAELDEPADLVRLGSTDLRFSFSPSEVDPARPVRARLLVAGAPGEQARVHVDGAPYTDAAREALDTWEFGVPAGEHAWRADGAAVFLSVPPGHGESGRHRARAVHVVGPGETVSWGPMQGPTRLEIRSVGATFASLQLRWSSGEQQSIRLEPGVPESGIFGLPEGLSAPVRPVLVPPVAGASLEAAAVEGRVALAAYVEDTRAGDAGRSLDAASPDDPSARARDGCAPTAGPATESSFRGPRSDEAACLEQLRRSTDAIDATADPEAYLERARALAWLGRLARARRDVERAAHRGATPEALARVEGLLRARGDEAHVPLEGAPVGIWPLHPYGLAIDPSRADLLERARAAETSERAGRPLEAAAALRSLASAGPRDEPSRMSLTLAALRLYADALEVDPDALADAPWLFGLARTLPVRSPSTRAAEARAAARSRWQNLGADGGGGFERLELAEPEPPGTHERFARAMLGLAADDPAIVLWSGLRASLRTPSPIGGIALRCADAAASEASDADPGCAFSVRWGDAAARVERLRGGERRTIPAPPASAATTVEVTLDPDSTSWGSVASADGGRTPFRIRLTGQVATAAVPVVFHLLGPTTVELELRALGGAHARAEVRTTTPGPDPATPGATERLVADLPDARVRAQVLPARTLSVGAATTLTLPVTHLGPLTLAVHATAGEVLVRARMRVADRAGTSRHAGSAPLLAAPASVEPPAATAAPAWQPPPLEEPPGAGALGTFSASLGVLSHDVSDTDNAARASSFLGLTAVHRLAVVPGWLWLRTEAATRLRLDLAPAVGARVQAHLDDLGLGLRLGVLAGVDAMPEGGAFSVRGEVRLDRPFELSRDLTLLPRLVVLGFHSSLDRALVPTAVDFEVWNPYRADHPVQWLPSTTLRFAPVSDARIELGVGAASNSDLTTLDRIDASLSCAFVTDLFLPRTLLGRFTYRPGIRLEDDHRPQTYLRHDLSIDLGYHLSLGPSARLVLGVSGTVFLQASGIDTMAFATVGIDVFDGRGLTDFSPPESAFSGVLDHSGSSAAGIR